MGITKIASGIFILMATIALLILGSEFIIPIVLAVLIWFLIKELRILFTKIPFIGKKMPKWLTSLLASLILFGVLGFVVNVLVDNFNNLALNLPKYEDNVQVINDRVVEKYNLDFSSSLENYLGNFDFSDLIKKILNSLSDLFSQGFLIGFYVLFLFFEENVFGDKLRAIYSKGDQYQKISQTLEKIDAAISTYISLKTLVSLLTGILSYIALRIIGVDTPFFWAFLIFILNYIPTVGSLIATFFPATIALLQFGDLTYFFVTIGVIGIIQVIIGNIVEPKVLGNSLNISAFVVILALTFWGMIWGVVGMFLSVPITVIMIILMAQFESTKSIAILLSEKGKV
ncbi:MAG: AI-2E family transporter [Putridiphycobacter sp.]